MSSTRAPDLSGVVLDGRYELHAVIGEGSFGRVYRGRDRRLGRAVAVKVIKPWWTEDPAWLRTFERETQLLASLSHPGIVGIFDVGSAAEGHYLVTELVEGESLARRLEHGPLPSAEAGRVARELAAALACAHAGRIVHRDIKPENVLLTRAGAVKVGDFGVARLAAGTTEAPAGTVVGTPRYMAPEQARGGSVTPATDVYAAGVVLYEMLAGRPPFTGTSAVEIALRHVSDPPPPLPASVDARLRAVVMRSLAKAPGERYADGAELGRALAATGAAAHPEPAARRPADALGRGATRRPVATRVGNPLSIRRNVNPSERRQRTALFALVLLVIAGLIAGAAALAPGSARVPALRGLTRAAAGVRLERAGLHARFSRRYDNASAGTVIDQRPGPGSTVDAGRAVTVVLSAGPPPVPVPPLTGVASADAGSRLARIGLRAAMVSVIAPGTAAGVVVGQSPAPGARLRPGATVTLQIAEVPRWRPLTAVGGADTSGGRSVPFRIRGRHWRLLITMHYQGTCTFIVFCSGPSAQVLDPRTGRTVDSFDLGTGTAQARVEPSGSGLYQLRVSPGSDSAKWRIAVEDRY